VPLAAFGFGSSFKTNVPTKMNTPKKQRLFFLILGLSCVSLSGCLGYFLGYSIPVYLQCLGVAPDAIVAGYLFGLLAVTTGLLLWRAWHHD
jgi:hypothetical protein